MKQTKHRQKWQRIYPMVLGFVVAMAMAMPAYGFMGSKFERELKTEESAVKLVREVVSGGSGIVTATELKGWIDNGKEMVILDTMPYESSYKKAHVPGAKQFLFPIPDMNTWDTNETAGKSQADFQTLLGADKEMPVVVYCGFVKCTRSHNGAVWAKKMGYKNVYRFAGGIYAWKGADYPIATAE